MKCNQKLTQAGMKKLKLGESGARGWFIGDFAGAAVRTKDFEVCWQSNPAGAKDAPHYHKVITELQLITVGRMIINGVEFVTGDIYMSEPGEHYHAEYLEDTSVIAVKFPSVPGDKYYL